MVFRCYSQASSPAITHFFYTKKMPKNVQKMNEDLMYFCKCEDVDRILFNKFVFALFLITIQDRFCYIHIFNKLIVVKYTVYSYFYIYIEITVYI